MVTNTLFLVRHGENRANIRREFSYKKIDHPLTALGVRQAEQTAAYFAGLGNGPGGQGNGRMNGQGIDAIISSPLKRARQTAEIIGAATGHAVTVVEEFREINCGDFDGAPPTDALWEHHDRILRSWRDGDLDAQFPGGENYHMLLARVRKALAQAVAGRDGQKIVIVAHGGIVGASLKDVCPDLDPRIIWTVPNRNCAVTEVELHAPSLDADMSVARGVLKRWADCSHLIPST
jgi:broad specificity phosphatase PhoE